MTIIIGDSYKVILKINNTILTYTCKIISEDNFFITFVDKFGKEYTYNKNLILSIEKFKEVGK